MRPPAIARCRQFRQTRVLIVGCGDVGVREAQALMTRKPVDHARVRALAEAARDGYAALGTSESADPQRAAEALLVRLPASR